ncbi:MAG: hypothetical protein ABIL58_17895 [Pseudomonadota bacterium]
MKKYQPARTDLLINTDWGIARDGMTAEGAKAEKRLLFHGRWVTREEKKQLKDAHHAYRSIRMLGFLLLAFALIVIVNIGEISKGGMPAAAIAGLSVLAVAAAGIGLIRFARWARAVSAVLFFSFLALPFAPFFEDDKGAPLLAIIGALGTYYLFRKTARKIFSAPAAAGPGRSENRGHRTRSAIGIIAVMASLLAGYVAFDLGRAKRMAADACNRAEAGMPLEDYWSRISENDYRIINGAGSALIVPKSGMGRHHCRVFHDAGRITGASAGFND